MKKFVLIASLLLSLNLRAEESAMLVKLKKEAAEGNPQAQLWLSTFYLDNSELEVDESKALELVRKAADGGYVPAKTELAEMYASGLGEPRNPGESPVALCLEAAKMGDGDAMLNLTERYIVGYGVERDYLEGARWIGRALGRNGNAVRQFLDPSGAPIFYLQAEQKSFAEFLALYIKARQGEDAEAMLKVGKAFLRGENGKPNPLTAFFWLTFSERLGNEQAAELAKEAKGKLAAEQAASVPREVAAYQQQIRLQKELKAQQKQQ
jgi:TPR repeat protein